MGGVLDVLEVKAVLMAFLERAEDASVLPTLFESG